MGDDDVTEFVLPPLYCFWWAFVPQVFGAVFRLDGQNQKSLAPYIKPTGEFIQPFISMMG